MNGRIWTFSNFLSVLRVLLLLPVSYFLIREQPGDQFIVVSLLVMMALTDFFDGFFARAFHQISDVGKIIDPLADKIGVIVVSFILVSKGHIPLWFFCVALARDVLILLGGVYVRNVTGKILQSNMTGKWAVAVIAFYILLTVIHADTLAKLTQFFMVASVAMMIVSFTLYAKRFANVLRTKKHQGA
jgi:CDP-diacylglycerol--glycerol-3-phosphate 3-phosphatidyltransferase